MAPRKEITIKHPDGRMMHIKDHYPPDNKATASKGMWGDTELAHVNPWEELLLKRLGGAGTRNPRTGLKQFYIDPLTGLENGLSSGADATAGNFNLPLDIMPTSGSNNTSNSNNFGMNTGDSSGYNTSSNIGANFSNNQSNQGSSQSGNSFSGLSGGYADQLLSALMPQLRSSITNMPGNIDTYTGQALNAYNQMMKNQLKKTIPGAISNLANRGIINSTEGSNLLSDVISNAQQGASDKGYQTAMQAALMKANMPTILGQLVELGKISNASNAGSSFGTSTGQSGGYNVGNAYGENQANNFGINTGTSNSQGTSYSQDPTVMYRTLMDFLTQQI